MSEFIGIENEFEFKSAYYRRIDDYNCSLYALAITQLEGVKKLQNTLNETLEKLTPSQYPKYINYIAELQKNIESMQNTANKNFNLSCSIEIIAKSIVQDYPDIENS